MTGVFQNMGGERIPHLSGLGHGKQIDLFGVIVHQLIDLG